MVGIGKEADMSDTRSITGHGLGHRSHDGGVRADQSRESAGMVDTERNGTASRPQNSGAVRAVAYVRTPEEAGADGALARQEAAIRRHAQERGWSIAAVHGDRGDGRGLFNREGLAAAVADVEGAASGEVAVLLVAELDRLTESPAGLARLLGRAADRGWEIVALDIEMDTTTEAGRRTADALRQVGAWRRRRISQGTKRGMARAAAQGRLPGRPRTMPESSLTRLRALRASGLSLRLVAVTMNEEGSRGPHGGRWSERTVRAALARYGAREPVAGHL
jgi:DNA invertase Pin-like site-specific DNA recombinase